MRGSYVADVDLADKVDRMMDQTVSQLLEKMKDDEIERLHQTLRLHLASKDGENDLVVDELLQAVEYEQTRRV